ncbi:pilus assembly protein PilW [Vibrio albus]|uniref:Pilus assembly protein PilW n=1 Tax=Vibrio albus TaxID=2200953 RepID=A0A2U3BCK0_9VIBR|nr:pilus assembly protein PilW [Vibrio albus]PWI34512.1 pilus assembly protein PilW [Vibrio albus]
MGMMPVRNNKKKALNLYTRQRGASLIEFMTASMLSLIALAAVGSVFISGQKLAAERSKQLLLMQNLSDTLKYVKEDIKRAGYQKSGGGSAILSGASNVIHTWPTGLSYVYENQGGQLQVVSFKQRDSGGKKVVSLCEDSTSPVLVIDSCSGYTSMLDQHQIKLMKFEVQTTPLGNGVSSALVTMTISGQLRGDSSVTKTMSATIKQRNWQ